jgi:hypothetical protein
MCDLLAYRIAPDFAAPRVMQRLTESLRDRVTVRTLDRGHLAAELGMLRELYNDAFSEHFGYVPFTTEEFAHLGKTIGFLMPPEYVQVAEVDGVREMEMSWVHERDSGMRCIIELIRGEHYKTYRLYEKTLWRDGDGSAAEAARHTGVPATGPGIAPRS